MPSCRWNYRELNKYKRMSGVILQKDVYNLITNSCKDIDKLAIYMSKDDKVYWCPMKKIRQYMWNVGMVWDHVNEEDNQSVNTLIGYPQDLFEPVPI